MPRRAGGPGAGGGPVRPSAGGIMGPPRARPAWGPWAWPTARHPRAGAGRQAGRRGLIVPWSSRFTPSGPCSAIALGALRTALPLHSTRRTRPLPSSATSKIARPAGCGSGGTRSPGIASAGIRLAIFNPRTWREIRGQEPNRQLSDDPAGPTRPVGPGRRRTGPDRQRKAGRVRYRSMAESLIASYCLGDWRHLSPHVLRRKTLPCGESRL